MHRTVLVPLVVLALACSTSDDGEPVADTTATGSGSGSGSGPASDSGEVDHGTGDPHAHDDSGTSDDPPSGTTLADDTGADTGSGSTGAATTDTWENWALPEFFEPYCNACHPSEQSARDFSDYDTVVANEEHIRCGVAPEAIRSCEPGHIEPGHLPIGSGPFPSETERWRLVDWMLAGMPRD